MLTWHYQPLLDELAEAEAHAIRALLAQVIGSSVEDLAPRLADISGYEVKVAAGMAVGPDGWPLEM